MGGGEASPSSPSPSPSPSPFSQLAALLNASKLSSDSKAQELARKYGLEIATVSWEDCARHKTSAYGPCISDMTVAVSGRPMPLIRPPNFADLTWDVPLDKIPLVVGNVAPTHYGIGFPPPVKLTSVSLKHFLQNFSKFAGETGQSLFGQRHNHFGPCNAFPSLYVPGRDSHAIVTGQVAVLPLAEGPGELETEFNLQLQSYLSLLGEGGATLAILSTAHGTSAQLIGPGTGASSAKQVLWHYSLGAKCPFVGVRLAQDRRQRGAPADGPITAEEKRQNAVVLVQVPLRKCLGGMFSVRPNRSQSPFGTPLYGSSDTANNTSRTHPSFQFGGTSQVTEPSGGLFGGTKPVAAPSGGLFGGTEPVAAPSGGLFGGTKPITTPLGGQFGATESLTTPPGGLFGGTTSATTSSGGLFGETGGVVGQTQNEGSQFGVAFGHASAPEPVPEPVKRFNPHGAPCPPNMTPGVNPFAPRGATAGGSRNPAFGFSWHPGATSAPPSSSSLEEVIILVGQPQGSFPSLCQLANYERDERYPCRVTVQWYHATEAGKVDEPTMAAISSTLEKARAGGEFSGSLVTQFFTGRPTEPKFSVPQNGFSFSKLSLGDPPLISTDGVLSRGTVSFTCDGCSTAVPNGQLRYRCTVCPDYDLCSPCVESRASHHPQRHLLVRVDTAVAEHQASRNPLLHSRTALRHPGISCDLCRASPIVGIRYRCTVCPNFDMCESCEATAGHAGFRHPLMKCFYPCPQQEGPALFGTS